MPVHIMNQNPDLPNTHVIVRRIPTSLLNPMRLVCALNAARLLSCALDGVEWGNVR